MPPIVWVPVLIGIVTCFIPYMKWFTEMAGTIVHELGHAVVVYPFGGKLKGLKLRLTTEGEAQVLLPQTLLSPLIRVINLFAGYGAPVWVSLLLWACVVNQWWVAASILFIAFSVVTLLFVRNFFGLLVGVFYAAINITIVFAVPTLIEPYTIFLATIFALRGVIDIINVGKWVFTNRVDSTDFHIAATELGGNAKIWFILFMVTQTVLLGLTTYFVIATKTFLP